MTRNSNGQFVSDKPMVRKATAYHVHEYHVREAQLYSAMLTAMQVAKHQYEKNVASLKHELGVD